LHTALVPSAGLVRGCGVGEELLAEEGWEEVGGDVASGGEGEDGDGG